MGKRAMQYAKTTREDLSFFRWYCHPKMQDYIEGDLMEVYNERLKTLGNRKQT
jgi:hypothetical protein